MVYIGGGGWWWVVVAMKITCCQLIAPSSGQGQYHTKICTDLSNSKNPLVFNRKKMLNDGVDLMSRLRGRKKDSI
jgi:hypothetical protein